jgi:ABC-type sugar transport system substrate-binding protein
VLAAIMAVALTVSACSGGSADAEKSAEGTGVTVASMNPVTDAPGPTEAFTPPKAKHVLVLYCGSAGHGCVTEGNETKRAAESLGWKVDLVDGKLDPTVWNQVVQNAVASGIDGIISISGDPNLMTDAMATVKAKNVPFVMTNQVPTDKDVEGVSSYLAPDPTVGGKDVAEWIMADSQGKANVLLLDLPGYYSAETRTGAIAERLAAECGGCVVHKADIAVQTMGTSLAPLVTSQLQQHPDIDYVWSPDDCCVSFIQQGIQQAGKAGSLKVISEGGFADQLKNIQAGELAADQATATLYLSWLSVDTLGRLMAGKKVEKYWAVPQRLWTRGNIGDADPSIFTQGWNTDFDYEAKFEKMWGLR